LYKDLSLSRFGASTLAVNIQFPSSEWIINRLGLVKNSVVFNTPNELPSVPILPGSVVAVKVNTNMRTIHLANGEMLGARVTIVPESVCFGGYSLLMLPILCLFLIILSFNPFYSMND
jgi:hypothetical protein